MAIDKGSGGVALFRRYVDEKTIERQVREVVEHNRQMKAMTQGLTVKAINLAWKSHLAVGAKPNDLAKTRVHLLDVGSVYRIAFTNLKEVHERAEAVFRVDTKTWKVTTDPERD